MKKIIFVFCLSANSIMTSFAQSSEPTKQETLDYIRTKILVTNSISKIYFNEDDCTMKIVFNENGDYTKFFFANLDANTISWKSLYDGDYAELSISAKNGASYAVENRLLGATTISNKNILTFNIKQADIDKIPKFEEKMTAAFKRIIDLCGGKAATKDMFEK